MLASHHKDAHLHHVYISVRYSSRAVVRYITATDALQDQRLQIFFFFFARLSSMWDLSSWPGIEPAPPAVKAQSLFFFFLFFFFRIDFQKWNNCIKDHEFSKIEITFQKAWTKFESSEALSPVVTVIIKDKGYKVWDERTLDSN